MPGTAWPDVFRTGSYDAADDPADNGPHRTRNQRTGQYPGADADGSFVAGHRGLRQREDPDHQETEGEVFHCRDWLSGFAGASATAP